MIKFYKEQIKKLEIKINAVIDSGLANNKDICNWYNQIIDFEIAILEERRNKIIYN
jgi:predicted nucleotidyltransferase